jgi:hypothetical protein
MAREKEALRDHLSPGWRNKVHTLPVLSTF